MIGLQNYTKAAWSSSSDDFQIINQLTKKWRVRRAFNVSVREAKEQPPSECWASLDGKSESEPTHTSVYENLMIQHISFQGDACIEGCSFAQSREYGK